MSARLLIATLALGAGCRGDYNIYNWLEDPPERAEDHGLYLSMDVAPTGQPVIAYYDRNFQAIGFAVGTDRGDHLVWAHEQVDGYPASNGLNPGDIGRFAAMKVAPDGTVWAAYHNATNGALTVKRRTSGPDSWGEPVVVDAGSGLTPKTGTWNSMALNEQGHPVIAYHDEAKGTLKIARFDGTAWSSEVAWEGTSFTGTDAEGNPVEREADVGEYARLWIDGNTEYIAFYDRAHGDLHLLEGFAGAHVHTVIASEGDVGQWPSLAKDGDDLLIAFHDVGNQDLVLARRVNGGTPSLSIVDDGEYRGADTELFVKDGTVSVVYFNGHDNDMMRATSTGSSWALETLGGDGKALGFYNEVVKADGKWWVASYDYTARTIHTQPL